MPQRSTWTRILAIVGTILVWLPVAFMVLVSIVVAIRAGVFRMDYFLPAEMFPLELVGGALLVVAAILMHWGIKHTAWSYGAMIALLGAVMGATVVTGVDSSPTDPTGWRLALLMGLYAGFGVALLSLASGGIRLWRHLVRRPQSEDAP